MELHDKVLKCITKIGMESLRSPIFYNSPIGIRLEIGSPLEAVYLSGRTKELTLNEQYFDDAVAKIARVYADIPSKIDILEFDICPENTCADDYIKRFCEITGLSAPEDIFNETFDLDGQPVEIMRLYWKVGGVKFNLNNLFKEIVHADFGGFSQLVSSVYFWSTEANLLFHMYDDRGADIVCENAEPLREIYQKYSRWILDYDRKRIDAVFSGRPATQ